MFPGCSNLSLHARVDRLRKEHEKANAVVEAPWRAPWLLEQLATAQEVYVVELLRPQLLACAVPLHDTTPAARLAGSTHTRWLAPPLRHVAAQAGEGAQLCTKRLQLELTRLLQLELTRLLQLELTRLQLESTRLQLELTRLQLELTRLHRLQLELTRLHRLHGPRCWSRATSSRANNTAVGHLPSWHCCCLQCSASRGYQG